ncbi:MAG: hypothetical protein JKY54_09945 [Flavobacteriales bacterium]|nr:hypothetical protein [Flavobacteriales bacterium]
MKKVYLVIILSSICLLMGFNQSIAQCYKCGAQIDWKASIKGPKKALKKQFPNAGKVKWFKCEFDYVFGVRDFGDSTITYVQSQDKKWFAKETRYMVNVLDIEDAYGDSVSPQMITCPGPNILPEAIWSNVSKIFNVDSLDILNKVAVFLIGFVTCTKLSFQTVIRYRLMKKEKCFMWPVWIIYFTIIAKLKR